MAELTKEEFYDKWVPLLADNVFQDIDGSRLEALLADMRDSFASIASQNADPVAPAVNFDPVLRQLTAYHPLGTSELEYTQNNGGFTAYQALAIDALAHPQGEWRFRVKADAGRNASQLSDSPRIEVKAAATPAGPGTITSSMISDSTAAGRALLTAKDVAAQRLLLDKLNLEAGHYFADQPKFDVLYGDEGALAYLFRKIAGAAAPKPPINGHADDAADIFYGTVQQVNPALGDYELFYPGSNGTVPATNGRADLVGTTLTIRGLTGNNPAGSVGMRRAASGNIPASAWLTNVDAFTGVAAPAPTTPDAPFPSYDPVTRILTFSHALGTSELEYNRFGGTFTAYAPIQVDNNTHSAGEWKARVKAYVAGNRLASGTADSPAIDAKAINHIPVVNAGNDATLNPGVTSVALMGTATDPDAGDSLTYAWRQITGPAGAGTATGMPATTLNVVASNLALGGTYQFGFVATDQTGAASVEDYVVITTQAASVPTTGRIGLIMIGNSRNMGYGTTNPASYNQYRAGTTDIMGYLSRNLDLTKFGDFRTMAVGGTDLQFSIDRITSADADGHGAWGNTLDWASFDEYIIIIGDGVNDDMHGSTASQTFAQYKVLHAAVKALRPGKIRTVQMTTGGSYFDYRSYAISRNITPIGVNVDLFESTRQEEMALTKAYWRTQLNADGILQVADHPQLGDFNKSHTFDQTLRQPDGLHWTDKADEDLAINYVKPCVETLYTQPTYGVEVPYSWTGAVVGEFVPFDSTNLNKLAYSGPWFTANDANTRNGVSCKALASTDSGDVIARGLCRYMVFYGPGDEAQYRGGFTILSKTGVQTLATQAYTNPNGPASFAYLVVDFGTSGRNEERLSFEATSGITPIFDGYLCLDVLPANMVYGALITAGSGAITPVAGDIGTYTDVANYTDIPAPGIDTAGFTLAGVSKLGSEQDIRAFFTIPNPTNANSQTALLYLGTAFNPNNVFGLAFNCQENGINGIGPLAATAPGVWFTWVVTIGPDLSRHIYINGTEYNQNTVTQSGNNSAPLGTTIRLGEDTVSPGTGRLFTGVHKTVQLFAGVLTATQRQQETAYMNSIRATL